MDRPTAIRESLYAFGCGLAGLLPLVGTAPAILALISWMRVRGEYGPAWNPAAAYLSWGARLAFLGLLGSLLVLLALFTGLLMGRWFAD